MDGITYIDSRGDGRYLISNSKDQSIKLWDVRVFSNEAAANESLKAVRNQPWDYRWQGVPKECKLMELLQLNLVFHFIYLFRCILNEKTTFGWFFMCSVSGPQARRRYLHHDLSGSRGFENSDPSQVFTSRNHRTKVYLYRVRIWSGCQ